MAVYTPLSADDIREYLARYDIGALTGYQGISEGIENTNYLIDTTQGRFILTLFEKRINAQALPFCLGFMKALHDSGIPTAPVIAARNGQATGMLAGKTALVTGFLHGHWPHHPTAEHARQVGTLLARMHVAGQNLRLHRANTMNLPVWSTLISTCGVRADDVQAGLALELHHALDRARNENFDALPRGVIHADLFPDNVFFDGNGAISGVIDFYFACHDVLAYDLMLAINAWCQTPAGGIDAARARALIQAYQALRPLDAAEIHALPALGRAAALRIVATRLYDRLHPATGALFTPKDPMEHVRLLRYHAAYGTGSAYPWLSDKDNTPQ